MRIVQKSSAMQTLAARWKRGGVKIGFVPTMGFLHDGHMSLVRQARRRVGKKGIVVVSIYVNPTQFGPKEDLAKYPRNLPRDLELCRAQNVDVVFTPTERKCIRQDRRVALTGRRSAPSLPISALTLSRKIWR